MYALIITDANLFPIFEHFFDVFQNIEYTKSEIIGLIDGSQRIDCEPDLLLLNLEYENHKFSVYYLTNKVPKNEEVDILLKTVNKIISGDQKAMHFILQASSIQDFSLIS